MEINIRDKERIVEIWLTKSEKTSDKLKDKLKLIYSQYKKKKYLVAVFESGEGDLFEGAKDLILNNLFQKAN